MDDELNTSKKGSIRTIITNAVYGKSVHTCRSNANLILNNGKCPTQILGSNIAQVRVLECSFEECTKEVGKVHVKGNFDFHIWYQINDDTNVGKCTSEFTETITVQNLGCEFSSNKHVIAKIIKKPTYVDTMIIHKDGKPAISVNTEFDILVEVIGEAKIDVLVYNWQGLDDKNLNTEIDSDNETLFDFCLNDVNEDDD